MRPGKGRAFALGMAGATVLLAAGAFVALGGVLLELWTIHFELLPEGDGRLRKVLEGGPSAVESRRRAAIR